MEVRGSEMTGIIRVVSSSWTEETRAVGFEQVRQQVRLGDCPERYVVVGWYVTSPGK